MHTGSYIHDIIQDKERISSNLLYKLGWIDEHKLLVITCTTIRVTLQEGGKEGREGGEGGRQDE